MVTGVVLLALAKLNPTLTVWLASCQKTMPAGCTAQTRDTAAAVVNGGRCSYRNNTDRFGIIMPSVTTKLVGIKQAIRKGSRIGLFVSG